MRALIGLLAGLAVVSPLARTVTPAVLAVQPSGDEVPANLLRLSIVFAKPPVGPVLPALNLRHADGQPIEQPFLAQELWSPSGKILTVLLHPGRVKSGLIAHDRLGGVLQPGDTVVLSFQQRELKRWHVAAADQAPPNPAAWAFTLPRVGGRQAFQLRLDAAIDGRDVDYLALAGPDGKRIEGRATLRAGERVWRFVPGRPWRVGAYQLVANANLEDPAGNRVGRGFETDSGQTLPVAEDVRLPFLLESSPKLAEGVPRRSGE